MAWIHVQYFGGSLGTPCTHLNHARHASKDPDNIPQIMQSCNHACPSRQQAQYYANAMHVPRLRHACSKVAEMYSHP